MCTIEPAIYASQLQAQHTNTGTDTFMTTCKLLSKAIVLYSYCIFHFSEKMEREKME